jgi:hypothetical protein
MKNFLFGLVLIALSSGMYAQVGQYDNYEDVVYLKNGSIIHGIIVEQVPGKSITIKTHDGNELVYQLVDVEKFRKEAIINVNGSQANNSGAYQQKTQKTKAPFVYRQKGYFGRTELTFGAPYIGLRVINGYKFGRFGYLGIGVGSDHINGDYGNSMPGLIANNSNSAFNAIPFFIHYEGDILKKRITPYYFLDAGYAIVFNPNNNNYSNYVDNGLGTTSGERGAMYSALGFGVKFNTRKKVNFMLGLDWKLYNRFQNQVYYLTDVNGNTYSGGTNVVSNIYAIPGFRFSIGY